MISITKKFNLLVIMAMLATTFTLSSCKDDPILGCTDAEAKNYNALATESDGNCEYARDLFLGDYLGTIDCPGLLNIISSDAFSLTISEGLESVSAVSLTLNNIGLTVNGIVDGTFVSIDSEIPNYPLDLNGIVLVSNLFVKGSGSIDPTGTTLTGELDITVISVETMAEVVSGVCPITGTKQ